MKSESRYSLLDRTLHRLAFSTIEIQKGLADLEDRSLLQRPLSGGDRPTRIHHFAAPRGDHSAAGRNRFVRQLWLPHVQRPSLSAYAAPLEHDLRWS